MGTSSTPLRGNNHNNNKRGNHPNGNNNNKANNNNNDPPLPPLTNDIKTIGAKETNYKCTIDLIKCLSHDETKNFKVYPILNEMFSEWKKVDPSMRILHPTLSSNSITKPEDMPMLEKMIKEYFYYKIEGLNFICRFNYEGKHSRA